MSDFITDVERQYEMYCKIAEEHGFIDLNAKKNGFRCTAKSNEFNAGWIAFVGAVAAVRDEQQIIIDDLKAQLNNMETCYIEKKKERDELQTENTELQEVVLRDSALATKAQLERNEWQEVVKSQQKTIENLSIRHEVVNIQVDPAHQLKITEKVSKEISRGSRLTKHRIDLRGAND